MRSLGLVLALCGAAALIGAPGVASAFETQGSGDPINGQSLLAQPQLTLSRDPFRFKEQAILATANMNSI